MFSLGEFITTLGDLAMIGVLKKARYMSVLTEIKVIVEALPLKRLVSDVEEEITNLQAIEKLDGIFLEKIKIKTVEWST